MNLQVMKRATTRPNIMLGIVTAAAVLLSIASNADNAISRALRDTAQGVLTKNASGDNIIIKIDERTEQQLGQWPLPRAHHGRLVEELNRAGVRHVAFDTYFVSNADDPRQDEAFAAALAHSNATVSLPAYAENLLEDTSRTVIELPIERLRRHSQVSTAWVEYNQDNGGKLYRLPTSIQMNGITAPSIASAMSNVHATGTSFPVDYAIREESVPIISYEDVIQRNYPHGYFKDKNVIIGVYTISLNDYHATPVQGRMAGPAIQAIGAETLQNGPPIETGMAISTILALLMTAGVMRCRTTIVRLSIAVTGTLVILAVVPIVEYLTPYRIDSGAAAIVGITVVLYESIVAVIGAFYARITRNDASNLPNRVAMRLESKGKHTLVMLVRHYAETTTLLSAEEITNLQNRIYERLQMMGNNGRVYHIEADQFAWQTDVGFDRMLESIEGLKQLFNGGLDVGSGRRVDVTYAIGICDEEIDIRSALNKAVVAAKRADERNIDWELWEDSDQDAEWQLSLLTELDQGIDEGQVWVAYQPKLDLASNRIIGAEALVRWEHPTRGNIRPDRFIPYVESNGRIEKLTRFVLDRAMEDFRDQDQVVAVNISTRMLGHGTLVQMVRNLIEQHNYPTDRLVLEITESAEAPDSAMPELEALRDMGIMLSIDDFGTGMAGMPYLQKIQARELKIDRSYIVDVLDQPRMVQVMINMAQALKMKTVAEGVESVEIAQRLHTMGCDTLQGYVLAAPERIERFKERVAKGGSLAGYQPTAPSIAAQTKAAA